MVRRRRGAEASERGAARWQSRARDTGARPTLELVIDEIVVVGGDVHDRHRLHDALTAHLREALAAASPRAIDLALSTREAGRTELQLGSDTVSSRPAPASTRRTELQLGSSRPSADALARSIAQSIVSALSSRPTAGRIAGAGPMTAPPSAPVSPRAGGDQ